MLQAECERIFYKCVLLALGQLLVSLVLLLLLQDVLASSWRCWHKRASWGLSLTSLLTTPPASLPLRLLQHLLVSAAMLLLVVCPDLGLNTSVARFGEAFECFRGVSSFCLLLLQLPLLPVLCECWDWRFSDKGLLHLEGPSIGTVIASRVLTLPAL